MEKKSATEELARRILDSADTCGDHPLKVDRDALGAAIVAAEWCDCAIGKPTVCDNYCGTNGVAIFALASGGAIVVEEWSDSSGHGCQCGGSATTFESIEAAKSLGLTEGQRAMVSLAGGEA